jgi:hypothetical protein
MKLDKTIKLFKMSEKVQNDGDVKKTDVSVKNLKVFEGAHAYNINGIAFNSGATLRNFSKKNLPQKVI